MSDHLSEQQIERYAGRSLTAVELLTADEHLAECAECREKARASAGLSTGASSLHAGLTTPDVEEPEHPDYEQLEGYVDGTLGAVDREIVEGHLEFCESCAADVAELRPFRDVLAVFPEKEYSPATVAQSSRYAGKPNSPRVTREPSLKPSGASRHVWPPAVRFAPAFAMAVGLVIGAVLVWHFHDVHEYAPSAQLAQVTPEAPSSAMPTPLKPAQPPSSTATDEPQPVRTPPPPKSTAAEPLPPTRQAPSSISALPLRPEPAPSTPMASSVEPAPISPQSSAAPRSGGIGGFGGGAGRGALKAPSTVITIHAGTANNSSGLSTYYDQTSAGGASGVAGPRAMTPLTQNQEASALQAPVNADAATVAPAVPSTTGVIDGATKAPASDTTPPGPAYSVGAGFRSAPPVANIVVPKSALVLPGSAAAAKAQVPDDVRQALVSGHLNLDTPEIRELTGAGESMDLLVIALPGFMPTSPVSTAVLSDRPEFTWQSSRVATAYQVSIADADGTVAVSPVLDTTYWTPDQPLPRGVLLRWQVTSIRNDTKLQTVPAGGARFRVLDADRSRQIEDAEKTYADQPAVLGVIFAQAGMLDDAERDFAQALAYAPSDAAVSSLLAEVKSVRGLR